MKSLFHFLALLPFWLASAPLGHAQGDMTPAQKQACAQFVAGDLSDGFADLDQLLFKMGENDRAADAAKFQADRLATARSKGLDGNQELKSAEDNASYGEKTSRLFYCDRCAKLKRAISKLEKDLKAVCPPQAASQLEEIFERYRRNHTERCVEKKPYGTLCNSK